MNDRHPSGHTYPTGTAGDVGHPSQGYSSDYSAYTHATYDHSFSSGHSSAQDAYGQGQSYGQELGYGGDGYGTAPTYGHGDGYGPDLLGQDPYAPDALGGTHAQQGQYGGQQAHDPYGQDPYGQAAAYDSGTYATTSWDQTPAHGTPVAAQHFGGYDSGAEGSYEGTYDATHGAQHGGWDGTDHAGQQEWGGGAPTSGHATGADHVSPTARTADWEAPDWESHGWDNRQTAHDIPAHDIPAQGGADQHGTGPAGTDGYPDWDTEARALAEGSTGEYDDRAPDSHGGQSFDHDQYGDHSGHGDYRRQDFDGHHTFDGQPFDERGAEAHGTRAADADTESGVDARAPYDDAPVLVGPADGDRGRGGLDVAAPPANRRARRRPKPKRSALLTVAAPSLCVLGVTAVAASAITTPDDSSQSEDDLPLAAGGEEEAAAAAEAAAARTMAANERFDTQLEGLTAAADDYADRASRTQGRMDLEERKAEEQAEAEREAARQEELRPKFFVPVDQRGLSASYGQAGINWMSLHTGIDFPVSHGTPVRAATDGTVRTLVNPSYGNLAIVTAADGTETWYAHLSSHVYYSGHVQAGTVIAYSGNSGTSTGPHLHFEVRPGGGSAVDPSAWLRGKGLSPN
ncbi:M23 family metallopeptidase [Streptomyces sp. SM12]|uniref:M23 family metallopeptidase n=1 Tax=Streptomyces sp. SM12 TaxID=1071602 RepID=UPI000CD58493|nr:M23 family metallopeptidase [Streptomyces sp. SM12]